MNKGNYCSIEMAQRLVDAGIVLETDAVWYYDNNKQWKIDSKWLTQECFKHFPAPSFAELWDVLPKIYNGFLTTTAVNKEEVMCGYYNWEVEDFMIVFSNPNLPDAMAELLLCVKEQQRNNP